MVITMRVKANSFRRFEDPSGTSESSKCIFYVSVDNVADGIPMRTNPRDQNIKTAVAQDIIDSLESNDGKFHLLNRGIVCSAEDVHYNNKTEEVSLDFSDDAKYGNVDGGHTYKIVCAHKNTGLDKQYVQFEVIQGADDIIAALAEARNTSVPVDERSLAELRNNFDPIKEAIEGMPFYNRIAFKQNQVARDSETDKKLKMIDAREIVAIISMFDVEKYDKNTHPIQAYSSKAKTLEYYLDDPNNCRKYINVIPDIFDLYDIIECEFPLAYNTNNCMYGRKKFACYNDDKIIGYSKFEQNELKYRVPDGIMYPTIAAFRTLLVFNDITGKYEWKRNAYPIKIWEECKKELTLKVMNQVTSKADNPNTVGKEFNTWDIAYMTVERYR